MAETNYNDDHFTVENRVHLTKNTEEKLNYSNATDILQQAFQEASDSLSVSAAIDKNVENALYVVDGELKHASKKNIPTKSVSDHLEGSLPLKSDIKVSNVFSNEESSSLPFDSDAKESNETDHSKLSPPLGSSENPIQIIQQGNTYHSTQLLTQDQVQQIAQVLQQQMAKKSPQSSGSTVLYNTATNTRIVYRVIYPSELVKRRGRGRGRVRKRTDEGDPNSDVPKLSQEERQEKKKHRPRTRYGRISKPPSYMIKDYKRIHYLDFDHDAQDDSDGGYSDYHMSEEECETRHAASLPFGVTTTKPRNHHCSTCDRAYIGAGGLARHYKLHPSHGSVEETGNTIVEHSNEENSNDSVVSDSEGTQQQQVPKAQNVSSTMKHQESYYARRRAKLKQLIQPYHDDELMEVVLPRLAQMVTLWEFLLVKAEKGDPAEPYVPDIFQHFESLVKQLQKLAEDHLIKSMPPLVPGQKKVYVEIKNEQVANVLGLSTGFYEVKEWTHCQNDSFPNGDKRSLEVLDSLPSKKPQLEIGNNQLASSSSLLSVVQSITKPLFSSEVSISVAAAEDVFSPSSESSHGFSETGRSLQTYPVTKDPVISAAAIPSVKSLQNASMRRIKVIDKSNEDSSLLTEKEDEASGECSAFAMGEKDCQVLQQCLGQETFRLVSQNGNEQSKDVIQLVVPEVPVLGALSPGGQFENFLPSNIVVVQNADGTTTLQLPGDQSIPLETIQALLAAEQTHNTHS